MRKSLQNLLLRAALATVVTLFAALSAVAQTTEVRNFRITSALEYTQGKSGPLKADAYIPNGPGPFPAILFIHGGGWINGSRNQMVRLIKDLANQGYVGFTIDYDVDPVHFPASLNESLAALSYMREHAAELRIDPARIAVAGSSAGGELAALVALSPQTRTAPAKEIPPVQAAVILNGVLDLTALGDKSSMVTQYLGGPCTALPDACKDASPQSHVHTGSPFFFVGHGTTDEIVPFSQADNFVTALRAAKIQVRFFKAEGGPHTYWIKEQFYARNFADLSSFLALALHHRP
jgi:acetyl esterase/lipase